MKKLKIPEIVVVLLLRVSLAGTVQAENNFLASREEWSRSFGGSGDERAYSVQQTADGGYIMAGSTYSYGSGGCDFWLVKTDSNGYGEWHRTFGGSCTEYAYSVQQTSDGGYILAGSTGSYGAGSGDLWLIKAEDFSTATENTINEADSVISNEKSKGFDVVVAESLQSQAEQSLNSGHYAVAFELAKGAESHAFDIDQDGTPNDTDFASSLNNYYIYTGAAVFCSCWHSYLKFR